MQQNASELRRKLRLSHGNAGFLPSQSAEMRKISATGEKLGAMRIKRLLSHRFFKPSSLGAIFPLEPAHVSSDVPYDIPNYQGAAKRHAGSSHHARAD
jgi:hypothetical protein